MKSYELHFFGLPQIPVYPYMYFNIGLPSSYISTSIMLKCPVHRKHPVDTRKLLDPWAIIVIVITHRHMMSLCEEAIHEKLKRVRRDMLPSLSSLIVRSFSLLCIVKFWWVWLGLRRKWVDTMPGHWRRRVWSCPIRMMHRFRSYTEQKVSNRIWYIHVVLLVQERHEGTSAFVVGRVVEVFAICLVFTLEKTLTVSVIC